MNNSLFRYVRKYLKFSILTEYRVMKLRCLNLKAFINSDININVYNFDCISIGDGSYIGKYSTLIVDNGPHHAIDNSSLSIGNNTYIGEYNNIRAAGGTITIGSNCLISQHITIVSSNHECKKYLLIVKQPWTTDNNFVIIEDDVWIGANSVILPGIHIHKGAVVAAGSIVTKDVPEYAIVCGNPANIKKYRE